MMLLEASKWCYCLRTKASLGHFNCIHWIQSVSKNLPRGVSVEDAGPTSPWTGPDEQLSNMAIQWEVGQAWSSSWKMVPFDDDLLGQVSPTSCWKATSNNCLRLDLGLVGLSFWAVMGNGHGCGQAGNPSLAGSTDQMRAKIQNP
jgi:hypothetical protein